MAEGLLPPVIAKLVMDASEYASGQAKAVTATKGIQDEMARADVAARKMAASMESAAQQGAAAQERQAAAARAAAAATQELASVQRELTNGEITAAEAATRQAAAQERLAVANQSEARAALQGERASIAQAEAQMGASRAATENATANEAAATRATGAWGKFNGVLGQIKTIGALALGAVAVEAVKMSTEFNKQMEMLHTQAGAAQSEVDALKNKVLALAPAVGFGPDKLAEALYHIESVGYRGADAMQILKTAADGAQVGNASLDDTTYALTSTMKSFEMEGVGGATQAMGALNAIVGQGDMRMQDLNAAIGTGITSTAQTFGLSIESMGAGLTFLTDRGEKADTASTRLAMGITLMAAPSAKAAKILGDLGLASNDVTSGSTALSSALAKSGVTQSTLAADLHKPDGLYVALKDLTDGMTRSGISAQEQGQIIAKVFGGARTGKAVMALVQNLEGVRQKYDAINAAEGNFAEQVKKTHETAAYQWKQFGADLQVIAVKLGDILTPVLTKTLELVRFLGRTVADAARPFIDLGVAAVHALAPLAGPISSAVGALSGLVGAVANNRVAMLALGAAMLALKWESIVGGVTAAATAVGGLLVDAMGRAYFAGYRLVTMFTSLNVASLAGIARFGAYAAAALALVGTLRSMADGSANARKMVSGIVDQTDRSNVQSYQQTIDQLQSKLHSISGVAGFFKGVLEGITGHGNVVSDQVALRTAIDNTKAGMANAKEATFELGKQYHMSDAQIAAMAHTLGIDLGGNLNDTLPKFREMASALGGDKQALNDVATAAAGAAQDVKGFDDSITTLINMRAGYQGALAQFTLDIQKVGQSGQVTSQSLDAMTVAGATNIDKFKGLATDYGAAAKAMADMNIPMDQQIPKLQQLYDNFIRAATGAGLTGDKAKTLADDLGLIRPVAADVTTPGLPEAQGAVDHFVGSLNLADGTNVMPSVTVPGAHPSTNAIDNLITGLTTANGTPVAPPVSLPGLGAALAGLTTFSQMVHALNNAAVNVHATFSGAFGLANGGIVDHYANGGVRAFASGGENHVAQIAAPGSNRLWAEPETGGEAYIPLGLAKRGRSLEILAEVMKRFGITAVEALKMLGGHQAMSVFATGGATHGSDGASTTGVASAVAGAGQLGSGGDLSTKTKELTRHLVEQTTALKNHKQIVTDGHAQLLTYTEAVKAHSTALTVQTQTTNLNRAAVDALIPRVTAGSNAHTADHHTVDGLTVGYRVLTGAIQQTPTAHHTNTDAPGAVTSTNQIRTLESTIRAMQPKTDRINIDTTVSGVFASLFARGGLVGYAGGGVLRGPGTGTSDSILGIDGFGMPTARVSNGEFVVNEQMTNAYLPLLQAINAGQFANGGLIRKLAAGGAVASRVSDPTGTNAGQFTGPAAALIGRVDAMLNPRAHNVIEHKAADAVKKKIAAMTAGVGGGVARWTPLVLAAMGMLGLSPSLLPVVMSQMQTESGGNPGAINLTDSNAAAGHPSQGLMQVIPGTFAAYAGPFAGRGILDPLANIYAALNYARSRYGAGLSALGHGHGYASGGLVGSTPHRAGGGLVMSPGLRAMLGVFHQVDQHLNAGDTWGNYLGTFSHLNKGNAQAYDRWASETGATAKDYAAKLKAYQPTYQTHRGQPGYESLERALQANASRAAAQAAKAARMVSQARARLGGPEWAAPTAAGPTSRNSSWLGLHSPVAAAPPPITVHTDLHLDGKKVAEVVQTHVLKKERRNVSNGLSAKRP